MAFIEGFERVKAVNSGKTTVDGDLQPPQRPPIMSENYTINYPILAFKSNLPNDKEIVIVNLAKNEPQKFISIAPFKFVQFFDTGLHPQRHLVT